MAQQPKTQELLLSKARSRALSHELSARLLQQIDLSRYPLRQLNAGAWLLRADETLTALPFVESGSINAVLPLGSDGAQVIPIAYRAGEFALLSSLFVRETRHADLVAAEPLGVRLLPLDLIEAVLREDKDLLILLVRFFAHRLREVRARERGWLERSVQGRVCAVLARVALEQAPVPEGGPWLVQTTHENLSLRCGVSRPKLSLALKQLEHGGSVKLRRGAIEILRYADLADAL